MEKSTKLIVGIMLIVFVCGILVISMFIGVFIWNVKYRSGNPSPYKGWENELTYEDTEMDYDTMYNYLDSDPEINVISSSSMKSISFELEEGSPGDHTFHVSFPSSSNDTRISFYYETPKRSGVASNEAVQEQQEEDKVEAQKVIDKMILELEPLFGKQPTVGAFYKDVEDIDY